MITPVLRQADPMRLIGDVVEGRVNAASLTLAEEIAIRRWCKDRARASAASIQRLHDRGHLKNARRERREHLERREVLLDALFIAARKRWPAKEQMSVERAEKQRRHRLVQVFKHLGDVGHLGRRARGQQFLVPKDNGGTRVVTSFHWVDRARQRVLKSALTPFANLHDGQFMLSRDPARRGPAAVRKALLAALSSCEDDSVFLHFDVRNFYGSISHAWLERYIGLEPMIVRRQLHTGSMTFVTIGEMATDRGDHDAIRETDRRGIPQGSVISPLIAEQVMASVLRSAAALVGLPLFAWSDNLGVIVPRDREREIGDLVTAAFAQHGAGPFQLTKSRHPVGAEFKFLGVYYRKAPDGPKHFIPWQVRLGWEASVGSRLQLCWDVEIDDIEREVAKKMRHWGWSPAARETEARLRELIRSRRASSLADPDLFDHWRDIWRGLPASGRQQQQIASIGRMMRLAERYYGARENGNPP